MLLISVGIGQQMQSLILQVEYLALEEKEFSHFITITVYMLFVFAAQRRRNGGKLMWVVGSYNTKPEMDGQYYNLWSTDNDRIDANDEVVIKSVYDPSPVGYSLPASNAFTGFTLNGQNTEDPGDPNMYNVNGIFDKGYYFYRKQNKSGKTFFFPASGIRTLDIGRMHVQNICGYSCLANPRITFQGGYIVFHKNAIRPLDGSSRSYACPVRSAEEK